MQTGVKKWFLIIVIIILAIALFMSRIMRNSYIRPPLNKPHSGLIITSLTAGYC
jgi:hypothetical protein